MLASADHGCSSGVLIWGGFVFGDIFGYCNWAVLLAFCRARDAGEHPAVHGHPQVSAGVERPDVAEGEAWGAAPTACLWPSQAYLRAPFGMFLILGLAVIETIIWDHD